MKISQSYSHSYAIRIASILLSTIMNSISEHSAKIRKAHCTLQRNNFQLTAVGMHPLAGMVKIFECTSIYTSNLVILYVKMWNITVCSQYVVGQMRTWQISKQLLANNNKVYCTLYSTMTYYGNFEKLILRCVSSCILVYLYFTFIHLIWLPLPVVYIFLYI